MQTVPIENNTNLVRDMHSKAILSTDTLELNNYNIQKNRMQTITSLREDVDQLKDDINMIKNLLTVLVNK